MDLNNLDYRIIYKNKIDPLRIFNSNQYNFELSGYIQFLIKKGIEVDPELFKNITDVKRYPSFNSWPQLESVCRDILDIVIDKGIDIEDEKYSELRAGLKTNDSLSQGFVFSIIRKNLDFPMTFQYLYDDSPREAAWLFYIMVESDYSKNIPDFIFEEIFKSDYDIIQSIRKILEEKDEKGKRFLKYIDIFTEKLINLHFIPLIDKTKNLKKLASFDYLQKLESYTDNLKIILRTFNKTNIPDILLKFLKSTKFKKHIKQYFDFNPKSNRYDINLIKKELSNFTDIHESIDFKTFFNRK
jgi:hypothetical protein